VKFYIIFKRGRKVLMILINLTSFAQIRISARGRIIAVNGHGEVKIVSELNTSKIMVCIASTFLKMYSVYCIPFIFISAAL